MAWGADGVQEGGKGNKGKRKCERVNRPTKPTLNRKIAVRPRRVKPVNKNTNSSGKGTRRALHLIGRITNLPEPIVRYALRVKPLGAGLAAGVARNCKVMLHRLHQFKTRLSRYKMLRQAGANTAMLVHTGGLAALMHGYMALGVAPSVLLQQRRAINAAAAPSSGLGGQELDIALVIADGSLKGKADPAFVAHSDVIVHWAKAIWNS